MKKVLVTGAGVDKTSGIDFPLANKLLPEVAQYLNGDGKEFEAALRASIPGLRFNFVRFINSEIDSITSKDISQLKLIVEAVNLAVAGIDPSDINRKRGEVIVRLFNKLVQIQDSSQIDEDTYTLIREAFGDDFTDSDFVIDVHKMSLSDTFKSILKLTLRESLTAQHNPIADAVASQLLNIEQLLIQKFLGFYNQNIADVKSYIYISWCLWAFLVWRQKKVKTELAGADVPFYSALPKDIKAITLNYTTFLGDAGLEDVIYFHGGLGEYVRMDTRQLLPIENLDTIDLVDFVENEIKPNIDLSNPDSDYHRHVIPSLVPPLKLKPILSQKYIEAWAKSAKLIHESTKVVVVGYSFNNADEHFNDIVRNGSSRKYDIVSPDATSDAYLRRIEKVFGISINNLTNTKIQGKPAKTCQNLRLIAAKADEVDIAQLFKE